MIFLLLGMVNDNSVENVEFIPPPLKLVIGRERRIPKENASIFKISALPEPKKLFEPFRVTLF
jgi:hypothetical protein